MTEIETAHGRLMPFVGRAGPVQHGSLEDREIARFALASGDTSPPRTPDGHLVAPHMMLSSTIEWESGPTLDRLRPDGSGVGREGWLPLDGLRLMGAGQDLEFHDRPSGGSHFTAQTTLEGLEIKEGGSGHFLLLSLVTLYRADDGRDLVTCRESLIGR